MAAPSTMLRCDWPLIGFVARPVCPAGEFSSSGRPARRPTLTLQLVVTHSHIYGEKVNLLSSDNYSFSHYIVPAILVQRDVIRPLHFFKSTVRHFHRLTWSWNWLEKSFIRLDKSFQEFPIAATSFHKN